MKLYIAVLTGFLVFSLYLNLRNAAWAELVASPYMEFTMYNSECAKYIAFGDTRSQKEMCAAADNRWMKFEKGRETYRKFVF